MKNILRMILILVSLFLSSLSGVGLFMSFKYVSLFFISLFMFVISIIFAYLSVFIKKFADKQLNEVFGIGMPTIFMILGFFSLIGSSSLSEWIKFFVDILLKLAGNIYNIF
jgi:hypothetical protein